VFDRDITITPAGLRRALGVVLVIALEIAVLGRLVSVFTEAVNWDEFALLARADLGARFGEVRGGGRPGLVTLVLVPFARDCVDSVATVVKARIFWQAVTLLYLAGTFALTLRWFRFAGGTGRGKLEAFLAVGLLAFMPAFVFWSVQVRTDQAALASAVWGGAALMFDRRRWALLGGALFGVSLLCTQKGLYVIALGLLMLSSATVLRGLSAGETAFAMLRQFISRLGLAAAGLVFVVLVYSSVVPDGGRLGSADAVVSQWDIMQEYRETRGFRAYRAELPGLWVHWLLLGPMLIWSVRLIRSGSCFDRGTILTAWLVMVLGAAVTAVHGSTFPYFLMTIGLFAATSLSLGASAWLDALGSEARHVVRIILLALIILSVPATLEMLDGGRARQAATTELIRDTGLDRYRGYQVEGALFCSGDPDPIRPLFSQQIDRRARSSPDAFADFVQEFRSRPVGYIVESYRMRQFPDYVREFWDQHYVRYRGALYVAGFRVSGSAATDRIEVLVPGEYRWTVDTAPGSGELTVGGSVLRHNETIRLEPGVYAVSLGDPCAEGRLALALPLAPTSRSDSFYDLRQLFRLNGQ